jgi:pimeloyl-ACP methyl ester carboxylesterase
MGKYNISISILGFFFLFGKGFCSEVEDVNQEGGRMISDAIALRLQMEQIIENFESNSKSKVEEECRKIAEHLASFKYCEDVDQAAELSAEIENFNAIVSKLSEKIAGRNLDAFQEKLGQVTEKIFTLQDRGCSRGLLIDSEIVDELSNTIRKKTASLERVVIPMLFDPFLLKHDDPLLDFSALTTTTDGVTLPTFVYFSPQETKKAELPCVVWIHGGHMCSNLKDPDFTLHVEAPDQISLSDNNFPLGRLEHNVSVGIQPLARFLAAKGVAFATVEFDSKKGKGNVCKQIMDQVEEIKKLSYIDPDQMTLCGHSIGGYILSLLVANYHQFLSDNFKSIAFVSPVFNEAWQTVLPEAPGMNPDEFQNRAANTCNLSRDYFPGFAIPDSEAHLRDASIGGRSIMNVTVGEILHSKVPKARRILQLTYPFSPTIGMGNDELRPKLTSIPKIYILMGTADNNTIPATQGVVLAWRLKEMEAENWLMLDYRDSLHSIHRLKHQDDNPPSLEGLQQVLPDISQIAHDETPTRGTKDFSHLSNGTMLVQHLRSLEIPELKKLSMKVWAESSCFLRLGEDNEMEWVLFKETGFGKEILSAMEEMDNTPPGPPVEEEYSESSSTEE